MAGPQRERDTGPITLRGRARFCGGEVTFARESRAVTLAAATPVRPAGARPPGRLTQIRDGGQVPVSRSRTIGLFAIVADAWHFRQELFQAAGVLCADIVAGQ